MMAQIRVHRFDRHYLLTTNIYGAIGDAILSSTQYTLYLVLAIIQYGFGF
jgi:hypothetical protein